MDDLDEQKIANLATWAKCTNLANTEPTIDCPVGTQIPAIITETQNQSDIGGYFSVTFNGDNFFREFTLSFCLPGTYSL